MADQPAGPGGDADRAVAAFLAACGLSPADVGAVDLTTMMDRAGRMLLHSVAGLHGILSARQLAKQEFGIERTMIERSGNNPLKFTLDAKEAMHTLLCVEIPGFIRGDAAVEQAFSDIRAHEVAMLAALQEPCTASATACRRPRSRPRSGRPAGTGPAPRRPGAGTRTGGSSTTWCPASRTTRCASSAPISRAPIAPKPRRPRGPQRRDTDGSGRPEGEGQDGDDD